jgi:hypothetical protein
MTHPYPSNIRYLIALILIAIGAAGFRAFSPVTLFRTPGEMWINVDHRALPPIEDLADVPEEMRKRNWRGQTGGSCVHASLISLLRYQGLDAMATWWQSTYDGGEYFDRLEARLDAANLRYASANGPEAEALLEWAMRNRLGAIIGYTDDGAMQAHALTIVDLTPEFAVLLDNNHVEQYEYVNRDEFFRIWRRSGSYLLTLVYSPPPPLPTIDN